MFCVPEKYRVLTGILASTKQFENNGLFLIRKGALLLNVIASDGDDWDHVSVTRVDGMMPNWDTMCYVKNLFWDAEDCVVQFHAPKSEYVNNHPGCLHLWRKQGAVYETPPTYMIG